MPVNSIIQKALNQLEQALGSGKVVNDEFILQRYARDETSNLSCAPDIVVRAENTEDVSRVLRICNDLKMPVTPRGAGTGVTGGAVPVQGGVVLSLEKMNRILEIDRENMMAVVEPGVITHDLQQAAVSRGLMYPPDPASLESCSIGGNIAENAGGPRAVKYGTTKDYVVGLQMVLADGTILDSGGKIVKNATGYNLCGIVLGSEGTLAVVTRIYLKLIALPPVTRDILIPFNTMEKAVAGVNAILLQKIVPATIEFMEQDAIDLVSRHVDGAVPFSDAGAHLLIQVDGETEDMVFGMIRRISDAVRVDAEKVLVADSASQSNRIWKARRSIREAITARSPVFLAEDCVVPRAVIHLFLNALKAYLGSSGLFSVMFGHAGDGNVHIDVLKEDMDDDRWQEMIPGIKREIYARAIDLGGTITGEHGIGLLRKDYLPMALTDPQIMLQQRIKKAFDPNMILNPGKIFPFSDSA